MCCISCSFRNS